MQQAMVVVLIGLLTVAVVTDMRSSRIPNWLTFPSMALALAAHAWLHGLQGCLFSLLGFAVGLGLFLGPHLLGCMGAGDVKLMAAVGAIVGPQDALLSALLSATVGGLYALGAMWHHWGLRSAVCRMGCSVRSLVTPGGQRASVQEMALPYRLRYGVAIAGGTLLLRCGWHPFGG